MYSTCVSDVAGMIPDPAAWADGNAARVGHQVVTPVLVPGALLPVFKRVDPAAVKPVLKGKGQG